MADTTHTLRIKAELDTSQLQQELDRLNSQKGNASSGSSAGRSTGSLLTKLDNTLSKLNETLRQMQQSVQRASSSPAGSSFTPGMMAFSRMPGQRRVQASSQAPAPQPPSPLPPPPSPPPPRPRSPDASGLHWPTHREPRQVLRASNTPVSYPEALKRFNALTRELDNYYTVQMVEGRPMKSFTGSQRMLNDLRSMDKLFKIGKQGTMMALRMGINSPSFDNDGIADYFRKFESTREWWPPRLKMSDSQKLPIGITAYIEKYLAYKKRLEANQQQWADFKRSQRSQLVDKAQFEHNQEVYNQQMQAYRQRQAQPSHQQSFKQRLESYGVGAGVSFLGSALNNVGNMFPETSPTGLYIQSAGNALQGAGAGAMAGAFYGPWGAAVGAVIGGATALASSLTAASKQIDEAMKKNIEFSRSAEITSTGSINAEKAQTITLGTLDAAQWQKSREDELASLKNQRNYWLNRQKNLAGLDVTPENMKALADATKEIQQRDQEIAAEENILSILKQRQAALNEEVEAGQRLAQAERDFAETLETTRQNEERERRTYYSSSEANVQAYRAAQKQYNERIRQRDLDLQHNEMSMSVQRILGQIHTKSFIGDLSQDSVFSGLWRGVELDPMLGPSGGPTRQNARTPSWWWQLAKDRRMELERVHGLIQNETDQEQLNKLYSQRGLVQQQFSGFMQIAQALQAMQTMGVRPERVDLQGLTSLASRGGTMGESYSQPNYMATLDKMYDTLKSIDDNTREAEKNVWQ